MKKIAFIILFLFTVVQAIPTVQSLWGNEQTIILDLSEEKKTEKDDTKSKKEYFTSININLDLSAKILTQFHLAEKILPPPCFEKPTPPPNYC